MVYSKKCALFAVFVTASLVRAADECVDIWIASRCSMQKRKGNCVVCRVVELDASTSRSICSFPQPDSHPTPARARFFASTHTRLRPTPEQPEAQCPNPKKDGIKCTRARSKCMATCRLCDEDSASSCAAQLAEKDAIIASMTSPPPSPPSLPPPLPPPGADYPCDSAYNLLTLADGYNWYAPHGEDEHTRVKPIRLKHARHHDTGANACTDAS